MYEDEKLINNILHRKNSNGDWIPLTLEELSLDYKALSENKKFLLHLNGQLKLQLNKIQDILEGE